MKSRKRLWQTELDYMDKKTRNQALLFVDATLFGLVLGALDINTVVPSLVAPLAASPGMAVGAAVLMKQALFVLPQVLVALLHNRLTNLPRFIRTVYLTDRILVAGVIIAVLVGTSPTIGMILFLAWFAVFNLAEGLVQVPWMNLYATAVPAVNRGPLFGASIVTVSIGSVLLAPFVSASASTQYPFGMARLLGLAALMLLPSVLFFHRIEVKPREVGQSVRGSIIQQWREFLRNVDVLCVTSVQGCLTLGGMFFPFFFLLAQGMSDLSASTLIIASITGSAAGGVVYGAISRHLENKMVLQVAGATGLSAGVLCSAGIFIDGLHRSVLICGFALAGLCASGWLGYYNYLFELVSEKRHILLLSLINALLLPVTLAAPYLGNAVTSRPSAWWAVAQTVLFAFAIFFASRLRGSAILGRECPAQ